MFEFVNRFKKKNTIESAYLPEPVKDNNEKYIERIRILENKNLILQRISNDFQSKASDYETKYHSLLKASKEEINRIIDARKLLASDPNYQRDLQQLGLVSQKEHQNLVQRFSQLNEDYQSLKKDYDTLSRKLNNILSENL